MRDGLRLHSWLSAALQVGAPALAACSPSGRDALWGAPTESSSECGREPDAGEAPPGAPERSDQTEEHRYFALRVVDADGGAPIAGAVLETVHHLRFVSDDDGMVAFYEPDLMGREVFFSVERPGFTLAPDGFGVRGVRLRAVEGGEAEVPLTATESSEGAAEVPPQGLIESERIARGVPGPDACFGVRVLDRHTRAAVPLVFLDDGAGHVEVTDSQGLAAFCEGLGDTLTLGITSHGYTFEASEVSLPVARGGLHTVEVRRDNLAERLFRTSGAGMYDASARLGRVAPGPVDSLNGGVLTQDAVCSVPDGDGIFWLWGGTERPSYPISAVASSAARSERPLRPSTPPALEYIAGDDGLARSLTPDIPPHELATWLGSVLSVDGDDGAALYALYAKVRGDLSVAQRGVVRFDRGEERFVDTGAAFPAEGFAALNGQPLRYGEHVYFADGVRVPARSDAVEDPDRYECWTARDERGALAGSDGKLSYRFGPARLPTDAAAAREAGYGDDQLLDAHWRDALAGTPITAAGAGGAAFVASRGRFVRVFQQLAGVSSFLGELWYAEADTPMGPWVYAQKIVSHEQYTFYAPWIHGELDPLGTYLYFEGSYTDALAGDGLTRTPRYNRNQIMYRLALDLPELVLPVPVYMLADELYTKRALPHGAAAPPPSFFALDRARPGFVPVAFSGPACGARRLEAGGAGPALFWAASPDDDARPSQLVPLYADRGEQGETYVVGSEADGAEHTRVVAYVWPSPTDVALPVTDYPAPLEARAGDDQCLRADAHGLAELTLDASGTRAEASVTTWRWYLDDDACPIAEGSSPTLTLRAGLHTLRLEVEDALGRRHADSLLVEVSR